MQYLRELKGEVGGGSYYKVLLQIYQTNMKLWFTFCLCCNDVASYFMAMTSKFTGSIIVNALCELPFIAGMF